MELKFAIAHGLRNARVLLENIRTGKTDYHAIEIMACPGGCIGRGGQPYYLEHDVEVLKKREKAIYSDDKANKLRASYQNLEVQQLYREFLGEPGSRKSHQLLHTKFVKREL